MSYKNAQLNFPINKLPDAVNVPPTWLDEFHRTHCSVVYYSTTASVIFSSCIPWQTVSSSLAKEKSPNSHVIEVSYVFSMFQRRYIDKNKLRNYTSIRRAYTLQGVVGCGREKKRGVEKKKKRERSRGETFGRHLYKLECVSIRLHLQWDPFGQHQRASLHHLDIDLQIDPGKQKCQTTAHPLLQHWWMDTSRNKILEIPSMYLDRNAGSLHWIDQTGHQ